MQLYHLGVGIIFHIKRFFCEYWIHKSIDCCQTEDGVNYCLFCFKILKNLPNDDNTRHVNDVILRTASIDDDVITEFNNDGSEGAFITQTVISESCKSVFSKLSKTNLSIDSYGNDNGSRPRSSGTPPIIIGIPYSSPQHQLMFMRIMKPILTTTLWNLL